MAKVKLQGDFERKNGFYYEFDSEDSPLGVGGTGKVYKGLCVNEKTNQPRTVAVKFLKEDLPSNVIERARREAAIRIKSENLVEMLGFFETETKGFILGETIKRYHVVSELLDGVILDDLLKGVTVNHEGKIIPYAQELYNEYKNDNYHFSLTVISNILSGLIALHNSGYIHRDIDPTNIMVTSDRHIKLIDFGIAKQLSSLNTQDKNLTVTGVFVGKPEYAAPELALGDVKHQNRTTDIYAVGIVLFQLIVGHPPFDGEMTKVLQDQIHTKTPLGVIKDKPLKRIIGKATEKEQARRYQSTAEFLADIERLQNPKQNTPSHKQKRILWYSMATIVIVICGIFIASMVRPIPMPKVYTYEQVLSMLSKPSTANKEGLHLLDSLHNVHNYKATFLLSRIYFNKDGEYTSPEVERIKDNLKTNNVEIKSDNKKAHELLMEAIKINDNDYKSLYELGSDYLAGDVRTNIDNSRNVSESYKILSKAKIKAANNESYEKLIETQISKIPNNYKLR
jgi:serine/threonine protein kinase